MSDRPEDLEQQGSGGAAKPPAAAGSPPMSPTRLRMLARKGLLPPGVEAPPDVAPARAAGPPSPATLPAKEGPESATQPDAPSNQAGEANVPSVDPARIPPAPPQPPSRPIADSTSAAASEGPEAGTLADAAERQTAAPAEAAPRPAPARPAGAAKPAGASAARAAPAEAKAAEPEPDPEEIVALRELVPDLTWQRRHGLAEVKLPKASLFEAAQRLRDQLGYDYLSAVTAVDWLNRIEMVYHLYSFNYLRRPTGVVLRVDLERPEFPDYPICPSMTSLWPGANFQEREVYDLMGVKFIGHPDLRRILLSDDFPGHPLRKDFVFDYEYVLVRHLSYGVEGQLATEDRGPRSIS